jgi:hypothetical protein
MRSSLRALWPAVLAVTGCYPELTFDAESCTSSTQCERGKGCRVSDGQCIDIPDNSVMGSFTCTVSDDPLDVGTFGGGDVVGSVDEVEFSLIAANSCTLYPDESLEFSLVGLRYSLWVTNVYSTDPGRHSFSVYNVANEAIGLLGASRDIASQRITAFVSSGFYELDARPRVGSELDVYLEAFLELPVEENRVGIPCENGQPACGPFPYSRTYCATFLNPVCTADCRDATDCADYGGDTCDEGFCYKSCASNADCEAPLECLTLTSGVSVCV